MREMMYTALAVTLLSTESHPETVQTTDGRTIDLREDGTYEILETGDKVDTDYIEHQDHFFARHQGEYGRNSVRFMPIYKNISDKKIVGAKFEAQFLNAFGEEIFSFLGI